MRVAKAVPVGAVLLFLLPAAANAATVTPTITTDEYNAVANSNCSLREAIQSIDQGSDFGGCVANVAPDGYGTNDTVSLPAGTYTLSISQAGPDDSNIEGDLDLFKTMKIVGTGNPTIQQTDGQERVMDETATGKDLSLSGLTIMGGTALGGAFGGGIHFAGAGSGAHLNLDHVTITGNSAASGSPHGQGGGVWTDSPTTIANSTISGNTVGAGASGDGFGGGIYQDAGSPLSFTGITLTVQNSLIAGNSAGAGGAAGEGGGIYEITKSGDATSGVLIQDSELSGNSAHNSGGGINATTDGTVQIVSSLLSGNHATTQRGGGIIAVSQTGAAGTLKVTNSTVTGNTSNSDGGGIQTGGEGSVMNLDLRFATLAGNTGGAGSEFNFDGNSGPKPALTIEGTVIAAATPGLMSACRDGGTMFGTMVDNGYNVSTDPSDPYAVTSPPGGEPGCGITGSQPGDHTGAASPLVNALADNGGPTKTMQPTAGSMAIDNMPNSACAAINPAVTTDQRGYPRPDAVGGNCDSGAYEAFTCNGSVLNVPGPFPGCVPPQVGGGGGGGGGGGANPVPPASVPTKKCKKKHGHSATVAKKCKKKKKK